MRFFAIIDQLTERAATVCFIPNTFHFQLMPRADEVEIHISDDCAFVYYSTVLSVKEEDKATWRRVAMNDDTLRLLYDHLLLNLIKVINDPENVSFSEHLILIEEENLINAFKTKFTEFLKKVVTD
jgi:hypothetical protein